MNPVDIELLRKLEAEATKGPWTREEYVDGVNPHPHFGEETAIAHPAAEDEDNVVVGTRWYDGMYLALRDCDTAFIVAVRNVLPNLLALVKAQTEALLESEPVLRLCGTNSEWDRCMALLYLVGLDTEAKRDAKRAEIAARRKKEAK